ncbi:sigma-70 family RNA polymerase sigma factor [Bacillus sp. Brlt_9]|uniref:sigma-70 family RNA polymerase sigma factor n=1 Tax=Bacillus sp. Brlt_9 TaxID=3110916 RepID=UPI003F7CBF3B
MLDEALSQKKEKNIKEDMEFLKGNMDQINEIGLIKEFLSIEENNILFKKMVDNPTVENVTKLNDSFKSFYVEWRILKYLAGFIKRFSIDYDKRYKKRKQRFPLLFDKPVNAEDGETSTTIGDLLPSDENTPLEILLRKDNRNCLISQVRDEKLELALMQLTYKELEILSAYYIENRTHKEIAAYFEQTEQNISHLHRRALKKLREDLST